MSHIPVMDREMTDTLSMLILLYMYTSTKVKYCIWVQSKE